MKLTKNQLKTDSRNKKILELYRNGKTLDEIAKLFVFSRSRAQQIVKSEIKKEMTEAFDLKCLTGEEEKLLEIAVHQEIEEMCQKRKETEVKTRDQKITKEMQEKMSKLPHYSVFRSLTDYARAMDEDISIIRKYLPRIAKEIINKTKTKWCRTYNKCRSCGTTTIKHRSQGLCKKCYYKSDTFKELRDASILRNQDRWRKRQREYRREYCKRPEVAERIKRRIDLIMFGGNREKALARDGHRCQICGMTREQSLKKYTRDLFASHLNDKRDNSLNNLITLCSKCFNTKMIKLMRVKDEANK